MYGMADGSDRILQNRIASELTKQTAAYIHYLAEQHGMTFSRLAQQAASANQMPMLWGNIGALAGGKAIVQAAAKYFQQKPTELPWSLVSD